MNGVPVPAFATALNYFDGFRAGRLPANLLQAQRDYFGAHTYERTDKPRGQFFHTNWTGRGGRRRRRRTRSEARAGPVGLPAAVKGEGSSAGRVCPLPAEALHPAGDLAGARRVLAHAESVQGLVDDDRGGLPGVPTWNLENPGHTKTSVRPTVAVITRGPGGRRSRGSRP